MTGNVKKGNVPQYTNFDKTFRRISEGDLCKPSLCSHYSRRQKLILFLMQISDLEPGALERKWRKEAWLKCQTNDGFRFSQ